MPPTDDTQLILTLMMIAAEVVVNVRCYKQYLCQDHSWLVPIIKEAVLLAGNLIILNTRHYPRGGTPIHYLYRDVPPNGVVI